MIDYDDNEECYGSENREIIIDNIKKCFKDYILMKIKGFTSSEIRKSYYLLQDNIDNEIITILHDVHINIHFEEKEKRK